VLVYFDVEAPGVVPVDVDQDDVVHEVEAAERRTETGNRFVARVSPRTRSSEGSPVELAVDTSRLYFFDPETGLAV
jgi:multiple sugar transport system ATP-binding protein